MEVQARRRGTRAYSTRSREAGDGDERRSRRQWFLRSQSRSASTVVPFRCSHGSLKPGGLQNCRSLREVLINRCRQPAFFTECWQQERRAIPREQKGTVASAIGER